MTTQQKCFHVEADHLEIIEKILSSDNTHRVKVLMIKNVLSTLDKQLDSLIAGEVPNNGIYDDLPF